MSKEANSSDWFGEPPYTSSPCDRFSRPAMLDFDISPIRPTGKINGYLTIPSSPRASTPAHSFPRKVLKAKLDIRMATKSKIPRLVEGDVFLNSHLNMRPGQAMRQPLAATSVNLDPRLEDSSSKFFEKPSLASRRPAFTFSKVEQVKESTDGLNSMHTENVYHASLNASTHTRLVTADVFRRPFNNTATSRLPRPRALADLSTSKINIQQNVLQNQRQKQRGAGQQRQGDDHGPAKVVLISERTKEEHSSLLHQNSSLFHSLDTGIRAEPSQSSKKYSPDPLANAPALTDAPLCDTGVRYYRRSSPLCATEVDNLSDY